MINILNLNAANLEQEHICCGFSDKKCAEGYQLKKNLIASRLDSGFVFKKADVRHKVFIEYCPGETAWAPISADNYNFISCFWVAGSFKGQGIGKRLLEECIEESRDKDGIAVICSDKKRPFLSDKKFFLKMGFEVCDKAFPYFELLVMKNSSEAKNPHFLEHAKTGTCEIESGLTIYYSNMCPFTEYYVNEVMVGAALREGYKINVFKIKDNRAALSNPSPFTIFSLYKDGKFLTHELMPEAKFLKLISL